MAEYTMHHLVVGEDTYEIVDSVARENVSVALSAYPTDTATGTIATFTDGADSVPVKSLTVQIQPQQAGSGEPSPDNIRAISGWDTAHVYVDETVGTHDETYTVNLPQTVYGGTLDVASGELVIDHALVDLGTLAWSMPDAANHIFRTVRLTDHKQTAGINYVCSAYQAVSSVTSTTAMPDKSCKGNANTPAYLYIKDTDYSDATAFQTALSGVQLVYEVAEPQTIQLTPTEVSTLLGDNNIYADAGSVSVVYRADVGLYIDKRLSNA